jgi:Putative prokaryotic signal transducing protein
MSNPSQVPDGWTSLMQAVNSTRAALYVEILGSEGITVTKRPDASAGLFGVGSDYLELLVRTSDLEKARHILDDLSTAPPVTDDEFDEG